MGLCPRSFRVPLSPRGSRGGWEQRAGLHACPCPDPHPGRSDGSAVRARSHRSAPAPREGRGSDPTYHAGRGSGGSGELALGLRTRPVRTVQVMIPADSEVPTHAKRTASSAGPLGDPLKGARPPGPPHRGHPEQVINTHPPLPTVTAEAGNRARRPARRAAALGPPPGPDPRGEVPGPGRGSPAPRSGAKAGPARG